MADFQTCYDFMMLNEDSQRECKIVPDAPGEWVMPPQPNLSTQELLALHGLASAEFLFHKNGAVWKGAYAISGINSAKHPEEFDAIAAMPQSQREPAIQAFYEANYWNDWMSGFSSDQAAMREMDMAVNEGRTAATVNLQTAINTILPKPIPVDGKLGPQTVRAANFCDEQHLVQAIRDANEAHYRAIVAKDPSKAVYLDGWLARARK